MCCPKACFKGIVFVVVIVFVLVDVMILMGYI